MARKPTYEELEQRVKELEEAAEPRRIDQRIENLNLLKEQLLAPRTLKEKLKRITDGVVETFDADFCRIWITKPGDLCDSDCIHARVVEGPHVCRYRERCLHLLASSGRYTHVDGGHRRVPFGCYKIGRVASGEDPKFVTNDVTHDVQVHDHDWATRLGLVSFAGYRLLSAEETPIGVLALFSKYPISPDEDALLAGVANTTAQVIQTAMMEEALQKARDELELRVDKRTAELAKANEQLKKQMEERSRTEDALRESERELRIRNKMAQIFLTIPDKEMYGEILEVVLGAMESAIGYFGYIDENGALVCPSMTRNIWDKCQIPDKDIIFPREAWGGLWGRSLREKKTLCSNEPLRVPEGHLPLLRALVVPLQHLDEVIGQIAVGNKQADYTGKDKGLLEAIAGYIAPVLKARLQRDRQEKKRKRAEETLKQAYDALEKRVEQRTAELKTANEQLRQEMQERKHADEALKESELRYRTLFESAPVGVGLSGPDGGILACNDKMTQLTGYSKEELEQMNAVNLYESPEERTGLLKQLHEGGFPRDFEVKLRRKDGTPYYASLTMTLLTMAEKDVVMTMATDITERKRLEGSLRKTHRLLRTLAASVLATQEKERKRISMELHDDFGQILTALLLDIGQARKLKFPVTSGIDPFLERIQAGTEEVLRRVRNLSASLRPGVLDSLGLEAAVVSFLEDYRERTGIDVVEDRQMENSNISEAISIAIYRIFQETMTNIVKHAAAKQAMVKLKSNRHAVALSITDDGKGFDPESLTADKGFGLLGMKERAEWLGGVFRVESALGRGTTIYAEIPLSTEKSAT